MSRDFKVPAAGYGDDHVSTNANDNDLDVGIYNSLRCLTLMYSFCLTLKPVRKTFCPQKKVRVRNERAKRNFMGHIKL